MKGIAYSAMEVQEALEEIGASFASLRPRVMQVALDPPVTGRDFTLSLVVQAVIDNPEEPSIGRVAERLNIDASVASRMVADCISSGLLDRHRSSRDRRRSVLEATEAGRQLCARMNRNYRSAFDVITAAWTHDERGALAVLLRKYRETANALVSQPAALPEHEPH